MVAVVPAAMFPVQEVRAVKDNDPAVAVASPFAVTSSTTSVMLDASYPRIGSLAGLVTSWCTTTTRRGRRRVTPSQ